MTQAGQGGFEMQRFLTRTLRAKLSSDPTTSSAEARSIRPAD